MSQQKLISTQIDPNEATATLETIKEIEKKKEELKIKIPFWSENPNVLFDSKYFFEFFPVEEMSYEQKLNAVTRTVIILTIVGFITTHQISTIVVGLVTICFIFMMFYYHKVEKENNEIKKNIQNETSEIKESFENPVRNFLQENNLPMNPEIFAKPSSVNPFSNVLIPDYDFNPLKKPAPASFNQDTNAEIIKQTKQFITEVNPGQPEISGKLYNDLGDQLQFEQGLRQFSSNPATTIPNDQQAFTEFCYGSMVSAKEGNLFALTRNMTHHNLY